MTWPIVGRDRHLEALLAAHRDPAVPGAVIRGAPGVGKTRLALEVRARLEEAGVKVGWGTATSAAASVPLGALAGLVPTDRGLADHEGALVPVVVESLVATGGWRTHAIVVDDASLLDPTSVEVVERVARQGAAFVVVADRLDAELPAWSWLADATTVVLDGLSVDDVGRLLARVLGGPVAQETVRQVTATTGGNAFLLRELVGSARASGRLRSEGGLWALEGDLAPTPVVRELIMQRVRRLSFAERQAVELVAVAEALPRELARLLVDDEVIDRLVEAGMVVVGDSLEGEVVRPAQRVHGEVVRAQLGLLSRRQLCTVLAQAAEGLPDQRRLDDLRVVGWRSAAGLEVPVPLLLRAAREARRLSRLDLAAELLADHAGSRPPVAALALEADVLHLQGRYGESAERSQRAMARLAEEPGDGDGDGRGSVLLGRIALGAAFNLVWGLGRIRAARELLAGVAGSLEGSSDSQADPVRLEVLAEACTYLPFAGEAVAGIEEASALLDRSGLPLRARVRASFGLASSLPLVGREDQAIKVADRALALLGEVATGWGQQIFYFNVGAARTMALERSGRLTEAVTFGTRGYDAAADEGNRSGMALFSWLLGLVELSRGRWEPALVWLRECRVLERQLRLRGRQRWAFPGLAMGYALGGRLDEARAVLGELDALDEAEPSEDRFVAHLEARARASVLALSGEVSRAVDQLMEQADGFADQGLVGAAADLLADVLLSGGGRRTPEAAERLLGVLEGAEGAHAEVRRLHAQAALERSSTRLLDVAGAYGELGYSFHQVVTARASARRARAEGRTGTAGLARSLAEQGLGETGMRPPAGDGALQGLPPRQREVAQLALRGLSNADIAGRLGLSARTVENHLHRAYQTLGVQGRAGLISAFGRG